MSDPVEGSSPEEPSKSAQVTIEVTKDGTRAWLPATPGTRLIEFVVYAIASIGAIVGPALTIRAAQSSLSSTWTAVIVVAQVVLLLTVVLATRFRRMRR